MQDLQFTFDQPLLKDTLGLVYVCEQTNTDLMVEVEMEMGGQIYVQQAALPSVLKRNTVYTLTVRKRCVVSRYQAGSICMGGWW